MNPDDKTPAYDSHTNASNAVPNEHGNVSHDAHDVITSQPAPHATKPEYQTPTNLVAENREELPQEWLNSKWDCFRGEDNLCEFTPTCTDQDPHELIFAQSL